MEVVGMRMGMWCSPAVAHCSTAARRIRMLVASRFGLDLAGVGAPGGNLK